MKMMMAACVVSIVAHGAALAQSCDDDSIESVSNDGITIVTNVGAVFEVDDQDRLQAAEWLPGESVLICGDGKIINTDENGETVSVLRLK